MSAPGRVGGKIALVTGAAGGLGRAICARLVEEGAMVLAVDIDAAGLGALAAAIPASGSRLQEIVCDVTEDAPVRQMVEAIIARHGRIDILVNNCGGGSTRRLWEASVEEWDAVIRLNLRSAFLCTRHVVPHMIARRSGRIVGLSSGAREGTPWTAHDTGNSAYAAAKAGIHGFTRNAALELAEYNIAINAVAPGPIDTERTAPVFRRLENAEYSPKRMTPLRRLGLPLEVANAVLFLASDEASYITGTTLAVAGGR